MNHAQRKLVLLGVVLALGWLMILAPIRYVTDSGGGVSIEHRGLMWSPDGEFIEARDGYGTMVKVVAHQMDIQGSVFGVLVIGLVILGAAMLLPAESKRDD